jgi:hypothetical protein
MIIPKRILRVFSRHEVQGIYYTRSDDEGMPDLFSPSNGGSPVETRCVGL